MGTFLYEKVLDNAFEESDNVELINRLKGILLEFGECDLRVCNFNGKKLIMMDPYNLRLEGEEYCLEYNRFENDRWEVTYMSSAPDKFSGIRSWAIGSKIGYCQHYLAIVISRILCECYSNGKYFVYGNIGSYTIKRCLAFIGNRFGFELVEKFIENRFDLDRFLYMDEMDELFLGIRDDYFYLKLYITSTYEEWVHETEYAVVYDKKLADDKKLAEQGKCPKYVVSWFYLVTAFLNYKYNKLLEDVMEAEQDVLVNRIIDLFKRYCIYEVENKGYGPGITDDDVLPENICEYKEFYINNMESESYRSYSVHPDIVIKTIKNVINNTDRADKEAVIDIFEKEIAGLYPSENEIMDKMNADDYDMTKQEIKWAFVYYMMKNRDRSDEKEKFLNEVKELAKDKNDIVSMLVSDKLLGELLRNTNPGPKEYSVELEEFLKDIFNDKRMNECNNSVKNINVKRSLKDNLSELINLCMEIYEKNKIIVTTNLFFWILEELYTENGVRIINWIKIFLESLTTLEQKEAFLWVMQDEWLRQRWFDVNAFM